MSSLARFRLFYTSWRYIFYPQMRRANLTNLMRPLKFNSQNELDLEFSPLVLIDRLLMDSCLQLHTRLPLCHFRHALRTAYRA